MWTGESTSGLLPYIVEGRKPRIDGHGDKGIQTYCFQMTLTDHPQSRIPFKKPDNCKEINYEVATGPVEEMYTYGDKLVP